MKLYLDSTKPSLFSCPGLKTFTRQVSSQADMQPSSFCGTKNRTAQIYSRWSQ